MELLTAIREQYQGCIQLLQPASGAAIHEVEQQLHLRFPPELVDMLQISDGIQETMLIDGEWQPIGAVLYTLADILYWSRFYMDSCGITGIVFADDGAGDVYYVSEDGEIRYYHQICGEEETVAVSLGAFFGSRQ